VSDVLLAFV